MRAFAIFLIGEVFGRKSGAKGKFWGTSISFDGTLKNLLWKISQKWNLIWKLFWGVPNGEKYKLF